MVLDGITPNRFLTAQQVAEYLGVSSATVWKMLRTGDLRALRVTTRTWRLPRDTFVEWLEEREREADERREHSG